MRPIEDRKHHVPHVQHKLAEPLAPVGPWRGALAKDFLDDESELRELGRQLLELEHDEAHLPVAPGHKLQLVEPVPEVVVEGDKEGAHDAADVFEDRVVVHVLRDVGLKLRWALWRVVVVGERQLVWHEVHAHGPPDRALFAPEPFGGDGGE